MESITVMEKVYKDNQFVLYINGLRGVIAGESVLNSAIEVLSELGYNIKEVNHVIAMSDDIPNNEADYKPSTLTKRKNVSLASQKWVYKCTGGKCFDAGRNIYVNNKLVVADGSIHDLTALLGNMGHLVITSEKDSNSNIAKGECLGCIA